ncbi:hypothetical protein [uncultured Campylobacter sp.]|jgi:hypothetical protein|uniref:hypothetical protein n=1 Tax=uncultured Campylobacter sp. TaxID=218934 RepID=UPI002625BD26|nr:hypothetical protein [uncultured Campylobacter sp.]
MQNNIIYQNSKSQSQISIRLKNETLWPSQKQITELFEVDRNVVTKHIKNILNGDGLDKKSAGIKFVLTATDDKSYDANFYNFDIIRPSKQR